MKPARRIRLRAARSRRGRYGGAALAERVGTAQLADSLTDVGGRAGGSGGLRSALPRVAIPAAAAASAIAERDSVRIGSLTRPDSLAPTTAPAPARSSIAMRADG